MRCCLPAYRIFSTFCLFPSFNIDPSHLSVLHSRTTSESIRLITCRSSISGHCYFVLPRMQGFAFHKMELIIGLFTIIIGLHAWWTAFGWLLGHTRVRDLRHSEYFTFRKCMCMVLTMFNRIGLCCASIIVCWSHSIDKSKHHHQPHAYVN